MMKKYEQYKPSGSEWLGDIPAHWEVKKLKYITYLKARVGWHGLKANEFNLDERLPFCVTGTDFINGKVNWKTCYRINEERYNEDPYIQLKENDLLVTKDGTIGKVAIVKGLSGKAILNSGVFVMRPLQDEYDTSFMYWLIHSSYFTEFVGFTSRGSTIIHLYQDTFFNWSIPIPSLQEQQKIAHYLDHKTAEIDDLIQKKQKLIALLREERTGLINEAVTKGINTEGGTFKDSGIEWLGEIPEHWEVKKLKYLVLSIIDTEHKTVPFVDNGDFYVVRTTDVKNGSLNITKMKRTDEEGFEEWTRRAIPKPNDILFTREAPAGEACLVPNNIPICLGQRMVLFKMKENSIFPKLAIFQIYSKIVQEYITILSQGTTVTHFNMSDIRNIPLLIPPPYEQQKIVAYIETETQRIDDLIGKIEKEISLLQEYRTALISEVVTGKVKVVD